MQEKIMKQCLNYAYKKISKEEIPIAAFIVKNNKIISKKVNNKNVKNNVLGHAEILAIQKATNKLERWNLNDCELYVTLKPCPMCEIIIKEAHISKVYYLLDRLDYKKNYQKTKFVSINNLERDKENYKQKLKGFFENKR